MNQKLAKKIKRIAGSLSAGQQAKYFRTSGGMVKPVTQDNLYKEFKKRRNKR
jgi:hypothetical protein